MIRLTDMVKRKAEVNIDEWLGGRTPVPVDCPTVTVVAEGDPAASSNPTVQVTLTSSTPGSSTTPVPAEPVVAPAAEVAASVEDEGHWL